MAHTHTHHGSGKNVAFILEKANAYDNALLKGIHRYAKEHRGWSISLNEIGPCGDCSWLSVWKGNGIIARVETPQLAESIARLRLPTVSLGAAALFQNQPFVLSQNVLNARLAADYLRAKGLKTFVFYGDPEVENLQPLRGHFQSRISEQGLPCHHVPFRQTGRSEFARKVQAADWLRDVPKPAGVLTCEEGDLLLEACEMAGLAVPGEVTILEIDREGMLQECLGPHLSLVIQDTAKSGYAAAALLGQMMNAAEAVSASPAAAGNAEAETRASHDKLVSKALDFIRENACGGITVKDVLSQVPLSRRVLEHRFRKLLGRTPHEEIIMTKLKRVKQLLSETHLSLIEIADKTGFYHTEYLSVAFKREVGLTPREYRRRHQQKQTVYF